MYDTPSLKLSLKPEQLKSNSYYGEEKDIFSDKLHVIHTKTAWRDRATAKFKKLTGNFQEIFNRQEALIPPSQQPYYIEVALTLQQINQILNTPVPDDMFFNSLKLFLENKWNRIKATHLRYTSLPNAAISSLTLEIAKELHKKDPSKKVYQYLMPTIQLTEDVLGILEKENIDDYNLDELILAEDGQSLIPVQEVLDALNPKANITFKHLSNPFNPENLFSEDEKRRLINFSLLTKQLYKVWQDINLNKECSQSLGWQLEQLVGQLRKGGAQGGYGGTEEDAGEAALAGIIDFFSYWNRLPAEEKINALKFKSSNSLTNLNEIINILTKEDKTSFDCVEMQTYVIEDILRDNQQLYTMGSQGTSAPIDILQDEFEKLKQTLRNASQGSDKVI